MEYATGVAHPAGRSTQCCIVAEVAQAHDGSLGTAHAFIDACARAGAKARRRSAAIESVGAASGIVPGCLAGRAVMVSARAGETSKASAPISATKSRRRKARKSCNCLEALDTAGFIWFYRSQEKGADDATQMVSLDAIIGSACLSRPSGELTIATPVNRSTNL
jgi:hypothetical protein